MTFLLEVGTSIGKSMELEKKLRKSEAIKSSQIFFKHFFSVLH